MKPFNIIDTVGLAYHAVWQERAYVFRLAVFPVLIKLACFVFALSAGWEANTLRLTLCLVPAYLAEGWMIAHVARLIVLNQRWPFKPTGDMAKDMPVLMMRARGVLGGAVSYALINLLIGGYMFLLLNLIPVAADPKDINPMNAMIGLGMLAASISAFKYIWMHIPLSLNLPVPLTLHFLNTRGLTLKFVGVWAMCFIPAMAALLMMVSVFMGDSTSEANQFAVVVLRVVFDTVKAILCTVGITLTFLTLMNIKTA